MSDADGSPATDAAQPPAFTPILSQQDLDAITTPLQAATAEAQARLTAMTGERDAALDRATAADKTASELRDQLATTIKSAAIREAAHGAGCIDIDTAAKYGIIKTRIQKAVRSARDNHGVTKENFFIDLGRRPLRPSLRAQLALYNQRVRDGRIKSLWVLSENGSALEEIHLL